MAEGSITKSPEQLAESAWSLVQEAVESGKMTLESGDIRVLPDSELVRLIQNVADLRAKRPKTVSIPEDLMASITSMTKPYGTLASPRK